MTCTEVYVVPNEGELSCLAEIGNSWRGAMFVWDSLAGEYLPEFNITNMKPVWDLKNDDRLEGFEKILLLSTFDDVICRRENIPRLVEAFRKFAKKHGPGSLLEQATVIEEIQNEEEFFGVCWNQTSVCYDTWKVYIEEEEEYRMFDISRDMNNKIWFLFDEV